MSGNRIAIGVGLSWIPEEFRFTGTEMATRGARTDEAIQILRAVCAGDGPQWVEFHGKHYDFDRLMISPAPDRPVPVYCGGHSEAGLRRAARFADGWISVNTDTVQLKDAIARLTETAHRKRPGERAVRDRRLPHRRLRHRRLSRPGRHRRHPVPGHAVAAVRRRPVGSAGAPRRRRRFADDAARV